MKLYNVFELFVITKAEHKFICKKTTSELYKEIFTKEKIKIDNIDQVEPLSNYYPLLSAMKPEKLSKDQLLKKYIKINQKEIDKEKEKLDSFIIDAWEDYVDSQKDKIDMPIINVKELKRK